MLCGCFLCSSICSILGTGTIPGRLSTVEKLKTLPKISRPSWTVGGLQSIIFFQNFTTSTRSRKRTHHESWWVRAISTFVKILHALSTIFNFRYFLKKTNFVFKKNLVSFFWFLHLSLHVPQYIIRVLSGLHFSLLLDILSVYYFLQRDSVIQLKMHDNSFSSIIIIQHQHQEVKQSSPPSTMVVLSVRTSSREYHSYHIKIL